MTDRAVFIGTSGWSYASFVGVLYPKELAYKDWLRFYAQHFNTVEINVTFYRKPRPSTFQRWYEETPPEFVFSVKAPKVITHVKKLKDVEEPIRDFLRSIEPLKEKAKVLLFQLPPSLPYNRELMKAFLTLLPRDYQITIEIRNASFHCDEWISMLRDFGVSLCLSDCGKRYPSWVEVKTADFLYVRMHGSKELYVSEYTQEELENLRKVILKFNPKTTYVYFDNTALGHAVKNAFQLKRLMSLE